MEPRRATRLEIDVRPNATVARIEVWTTLALLAPVGAFGLSRPFL